MVIGFSLIGNYINSDVIRAKFIRSLYYKEKEAEDDIKQFDLNVFEQIRYKF